MLLGEFKEKSKNLINVWLVMLGIQVAFFALSAIAHTYFSSSLSDTWIWEYLTLVRGESWAIGWLLCNMGITALDFYLSFKVHRENRALLAKTHSTIELIILKKMYRNLKLSLIFIVLAIFCQMLHGFIWWIVSFFSILFKFFYYRELIHLDPAYELCQWKTKFTRRFK